MLSPAHANGTAYNTLNMSPAHANGNVAIPKGRKSLSQRITKTREYCSWWYLAYYSWWRSYRAVEKGRYHI